MHQKLDDPHSFHALSSQQPFQLCSRSHGKSPGWRRSRPHQRTYPGYREYERSVRLLPLHVLSAAVHLREVSNLLVRLGCHRHLRRADNMSRKHYRDLQNNRWTRQQMPPLSITLTPTFDAIRTDMRTDICTKSIELLNTCHRQEVASNGRFGSALTTELQFHYKKAGVLWRVFSPTLCFKVSFGFFI